MEYMRIPILHNRCNDPWILDMLDVILGNLFSDSTILIQMSQLHIQDSGLYLIQSAITPPVFKYILTL